MPADDVDALMDGMRELDDTLSIEVADDGNNRVTPSQAQSQPANNTGVPKPKRLACMICRKRKLRCDGNRPRCSTCTRLGHDCAYDEVRRKSGPKRGYVKALEERLKQVETLLKTQEPAAASKPASNDTPTTSVFPDPIASTANTPPLANHGVSNPSSSSINNMASSGDQDCWDFPQDNSPRPQPLPPGADTFDFGRIPMQNNFTWEMIGLGLEEPLPPQESIDEFHQIYFEKIHPSMPMIHKYRYLAAMNLAPAQRPPVCLRYAIWTLACSVSDKFVSLRDLFYQRARKYVEADYIKGFGEHIISLAHTQTHVLLAQYEFKMMFFPRAWMSTGSAVRSAQMLGLHRLDGAGLDVKMCIPPPRDWTEGEERRRTFWMAFIEDRYASIGTGWPMTIDEKDVMTKMPSSEDAFEMSRPEQTQTLAESMTPAGTANISTMGGLVLMACLFGRNLLHLHRPDVDDRDDDLNGQFWKRHRALDNILLNTSLCLPAHLKLPCGLSSPNVVFTNMCIHTSTICLHQAAIFKADKSRLPGSVSSESKVRCITAANEIASTMRMISHIDLSTINPFTSFCLYVAARVFVQYLKSRPDEGQVVDSLKFLLAAMGALKRRNPLTESFLVQLDVDLEALGARIPKLKSAFARSDSNMNRSFVPQPDGEPRSAEHGIMAHSGDNGLDYLKTFEAGGNRDNTRDIVELDPALSGAPQQPIPSFSSLNMLWRNEGTATILDQVRKAGSNARFFGSSLLEDMGTDPNSDFSLSPDAAPSSDRPTPNSSTSASDRHGSASGKGATAGCTTRSGGCTRSFEASSASPSAKMQQQRHQAAATQLFDDATPGRNFGMASMGAAANKDTPTSDGAAKTAGSTAEQFNWETFTATGAGMTPMSEGMLRTMLQMGPMETMDLGWDNPT